MLEMRSGITWSICVTGLVIGTGNRIIAGHRYGYSKGVDPDGALWRIRIYCDEQPDDDYFTAVMI